jgi:ABC-type antimicrobial peptide transport system permease subunit
MHHWSQLATRNWRARPGRTALATIAIALGVGVVVWVTGAYESIRESVAEQVWTWIGKSQLNVESTAGQWGTVYESIVEDVRKLPNIAHVTGRLKERVEAVLSTPDPGAGGEVEPYADTTPLDVIGIRPESEYVFRDYREDIVKGRVLAPDDHGVVMLEASFAAEHKIGLGDTLRVRRDENSPAVEFRVVGLLQRRRIAQFQRPMAILMLPELQRIAARPGPPRVTQIDIILTDSSRPARLATFLQVRRVVDRYQQGFQVRDADAKLRQVEAAQAQTEFILTLISSVALFTAFFIILSTLSMGMVERIGQLGLLRCVGVTRLQMASLVLGEVVPMGLVGLALGVPVGIGLTGLTVLIAPQYVGNLVVSRWGIALALAGGAVTTIAGGILPALQAMRVSPLEATKPQARATRPGLDIFAAILGVAMIGAHTLLMEKLTPMRWLRPSVAMPGVMLLYCGYALIAPALIRFGGELFVRVVAKVLGVRHRLLSDQVGRASWRGAGICSGLMVGLSLIVCLVVHTESLTAGWDFPKRMCEAFVWTGSPIRLETGREAVKIPGIATSALANDFRCTIGWFAAGTPEEFFKMARLEFLEGTEQEAVAKLKRGGYILVAPAFAELGQLHVGSRIYISTGGPAYPFEIAGIVESPALDIAAAYFNADSHFVSAQVNGVMGTLADAKRFFRINDEMTLFLINFDLPPTEPPRLFRERQVPSLTRPSRLIRWMDDWPALMPEREAELHAIDTAWSSLGNGADPTWPMLPGELSILRTFRSVLDTARDESWSRRSPQERWRAFRENVVLALVAERAGAPKSFRKSVAELKAEIDHTLRTATHLMTAVPMVALIVAALGVGNLMMANVASRARQLAVLRAVGATKSQITRLVIGEALVLGAVGSSLGLVLGVHAAYGVNELTRRIWGFPMKFALPWGFVAGAIGLTAGVCLIAGLLPARRAARNNVVAAMQTG